jgi:hypothetical protein
LLDESGTLIKWYTYGKAYALPDPQVLIRPFHQQQQNSFQNELCHFPLKQRMFSIVRQLNFFCGRAKRNNLSDRIIFIAV